ncbi:MAG: hypothetical protein IKE48_02535 [Parasporobacterium sp.]|nr:hypothetical protein [Parasporobacterium sp.]
MRFYVFICLALICLAIGYSGLFKRKFAAMMPLSVFSSILVLYVFGLFGKMKLGVIVFIGIAFVLFLLGLSKSIVRREMKTYVSNVFSFGLLFFLAALILIYYMTDGRLLSRFDEFTHWGLTVKNYMIFDGFANVAGSTTHGAGYQPGISLFCYLFTSLRDQVNECDMLKAMDVFIVSMLLPIFRRISWKRFVFGIFLIPFVLFLPWLFATNIIPYNTLYIDAAMAVTFAFLLTHYYTNIQCKVTYFVLGMGSAAMILIRPGSEAFALMILCMVILDVLLFRRPQFAAMCKKGGWIMPVFYVVLSVASYLSWRIFTTANKMMQVFDYINPEGQGAAASESITSNFFAAMRQIPSKATIKIPYLMWIVVFAILAFLVILMTKGARERARSIVFSVLVIIGYVLYAGALLYMYTHLFSAYEGTTLASLDRYMTTYIMGATIFFLYMLVERIFERFGGLGNILILIPVAVILAFTPWSKVVADMFNCRETVEKTIENRAEYYILEEEIKNLDYTKDRVYFIAQNSNGYEYQVAYYLSTPVSLSYDYEMGWSLGFPYSDEDIWTLEMTADDWEKALIEGGYTHVYLYRVDKQFRHRFGELFEYETTISNDSIFEVDVTGGHVVLRRAF